MTRSQAISNERMTWALPDRLTHRVHILEAKGESYRLRQARTRASASAKKSNPPG